MIENVANMLSRFSTKLVIYDKHSPFDIGEYRFTLLNRAVYSGGTKISNVYILAKGEDITTYVSRPVPVFY